MRPENETYDCPLCGNEMAYIGGFLEWECSNCDVTGSVQYDAVNEEYYIKIEADDSYEDIYADPINNKPACCDACGGCYPQCMTSCKIFDD